MDLLATDTWICDNCGKEIKDIKDGWLEWISFKENGVYKYKGMRIVHRVKCLYNEDLVYKKYNATVNDSDLEDFSGSDGLITLLSFVSDGNFVDNEEILEIIKRIFIPGYEQARFRFEEAIHEGVFEPNTKPLYYSQRDIKSVLDYIKKNQ